MPRSPKSIPLPSSPWPGRLGWLAFALALTLVIARGTMQEFVREPFEVQPGSDPTPRAPGPAASIGLDLLCCLPAMLVLLRRLIDKTFSLRAPRSFIPLALLCGWMLLSVFWSADRFGALITACNWAAAMAMLWAATQLVRDWLRLRLVAAVAFGLLPVYIIQGLNYKFIELPELIKNFDENKAKLLADHGFEENSFAANQFTAKIKLGEMFGFESSPNTLGALLSLLLVSGSGILIQRRRDRDTASIAIPRDKSASAGQVDHVIPTVAIGLALGVWIISYTRSRTAFATPFIAVVLLLLIWKFQRQLASRSKSIFFGAVVVFLVCTLAVIAHGIAHGSLIHSSLTFRWHYWVGSMGVFKLHPLLGVGWNNFGLNYLAHRLPQAPEEVKDPHNFLVRFFVELGLIGGLLVVVWQLRLWWELTRPIVPPLRATTSDRAPGVIGFIAAVSGAGILLSTIISMDFTMGAVELEIMRRLLFIGAMIVSSSLVALRTLHSQEPDDRPAPWILYTLLVGVGVFLIHNLVDFSLFEIGPMFLFAILIGSALGLRQPEPANQPRQTKALAMVFAGVVILWLTAALLLWGPILQAERLAETADEAIRTHRAYSATPLLEDADRQAWRLNSDYTYRAAKFAPPSRWNQLIDEAIRQNPREEKYYRSRAAGEMARPHPNAPRVKSDYNTALTLNPNNVQLHLEYAETLEKLGDRPAALAQYRAALRYNDLLNWDEKKRLPPRQIDQIAGKLKELN